MQKHILAAQQAPKYALTSTQFGFPLYIADTEKTNGSLIADKIEDALMFSVGFDNPADKIAYWGFVTGYILVAIEVQ